MEINLPATEKFVYADLGAEEVTQVVRRLVLEIGYYDEDLPALVRGILAIADRFSLDGWGLYPDIQRMYFRGLAVAGALSNFYELNEDPDSSGVVHIEYSHQSLTGERVLRMEVNGVAIAYEGRVERQDGEVAEAD